MKTIECTWDLEALGVETYEIEVQKASDFDILNSITELKSNGAKYIVLKLPSDRIKLSYELSKLGLVFAEVQLSIQSTYKLFKTLNKDFMETFGSIEMRPMDNHAQLQEVLNNISSDMFTTDRIALHPAFGVSFANARYINWIKQSFNSSNTLLYQSYNNDAPVGFAMHKVENKTIWGQLGGVYEAFQGSGFFVSGLYQDMMRYYKQGFNTFKTKISSNNFDILKLYQFMGFQIYGIRYVYHTVEW